MTKLFIVLTILFIALVSGFFALNSYIYNEKQAEVPNEFVEPSGEESINLTPQEEPAAPNEVSSEPYRTALVGTYVCLPHKDTTGPQTDECAFGIEVAVGEYYAVDLNLMSQEHAPLTVGQKISANGVVTPIERLSTNHWQKYNVKGIFSITDSLQVIAE